MANNKLIQDGFLHIANVIDAIQISNLLHHINHLLTTYKNTESILYEHGSPKKLLYPFDKGEIFLQFLVSDSLLQLLLENSDAPTAIVPTWEDIVIKQPFTQSGFNPHQDLPMQSLVGNTFSIAIYLHDSTHNPVFFLPGSYQLGPLTRTQINELYEREKNNFVPVPAKAGDVVMHYAKTVHYSQPNLSPLPRYTWYLEFRTLKQLFQDSPWDRDWILRRRAIFVYALKQYNPAKLNILAPDYEQLKPYLKNIQLKVPHVTSSVDYDMKSPYYHF